ncbi:MAG: lytic transglycosylase domain-containing protein, partial [Alphaproteobacteria bacterium]|nr:lytic transglycosylase domain-containing protein [Alphaproteobacteria bacterium]
MSLSPALLVEHGPRPSGPEAVRAAIAEGARASGADFGHLLRTAMRESSLDPEARARTSSASGLFQFIEQTWLGVIDRHGARHGLGDIAALIERTPAGRYEIADPARRAEVLDLRFDPAIAARMAGELTAENARSLEARLGREVTDGELYAAHFLGPRAAAELIETAEADPDANAAALFPAAATANRSIFYGPGGAALPASEVLAKVTRLPDAAPAPRAEGPALR